jgi:hypothetical protein
VDKERNIFRINCSVRTGVRAGFTADTSHIMPHKQFAILFLLLQSIHRTGGNAVRLFTLSTNKGISSKLDHGHYSVVIRMIEVAALDIAALALVGCTDVQVDIQSQVRTCLRIQIYFSLVDLFCTGRHRNLSQSQILGMLLILSYRKTGPSLQA